jgi:DNA-binding response OmpR family regulator
MRVLVAEDDRGLSHVLCSFMHSQGWYATPAFDAMQAMMYALRTPCPDAIVLDLNMPGGAGLETLKKLKTSSRTVSIPVVVISATTDEAVIQTASELGAAKFVAKPVDPKALGTLLCELVKGS